MLPMLEDWENEATMLDAVLLMSDLSTRLLLEHEPTVIIIALAYV